MNEEYVKALRLLRDMIISPAGIDIHKELKDLSEVINKLSGATPIGTTGLKRYRLEIPKDVPKKYINCDPNILKADGMVMDRVDFWSVGDPSVRCKVGTFVVLESWLVEIEEQPAANAWLKKYPDRIPDEHGWPHTSYAPYCEGYEDGAKDNELKHRETESFEEWFKHNQATWDEKNIVIDRDTLKDWLENTWKAHAKSRRYE